MRLAVVPLLVVSVLARGPPFGEEVGRREGFATPEALLQNQHFLGKASVDHPFGSPRPGSNPAYLAEYFNHFSLPEKDASTHFHNLFHRLSNSSNPLSFSVTKSPQFNILAYASSPSNAGVIRVEPVDMEGMLTQLVYVPAGRRRDGAGGVGGEIKFAGWRVEWRGVEMIIYEANWVENGWLFTSQKHILLLSLPPQLTPAPPASLLAAHAASPSAVGSDADIAASLFVLEVSAWNSDVRDTILVFDQSTWRADAGLWASVQKASWSDVILDADLKSSLIHEYRSFFSSEKIYKSLGVPWKRGIIFLGPPGNGKTISLKAVMKEVGRERGVLYVKSFHTYAGDEMGIRLIFQKARQEAPCLLVFEDIDSLITENNRSFFLNEVDGLEDNDGLLMIGTTNHFDKLDPALSNRPSRFDRKYTFPNPTTAERYAYAEYWRDKLASNPRIEFPKSLMGEVAGATGGFSFAYLKEAFVSTLIILASDETKELVFGKVLMGQVKVLRKELESGRGEEVRGEGLLMGGKGGGIRQIYMRAS